MNIKERIIILGSVISCILIQTQGADKYTDGNRPYEFGFSIDGEQHRHEKKDENGLIHGEFGFITADGVYHVTVYATDEQGRFKILSMKNIRVKPYPTYTAKQTDTSARQGHSLEQTAQLPSVAPPVSTTTTFKPISIEPPANSCSHCSLGPKPTSAPVLNPPNPNQIEASGNPKFPQGIKPQSNFVNQPNNGNPPQGLSVQANAPYNPNQPQNNLAQTPFTQSLVPPHNSPSSSQPGFGYNQSPTAGFGQTPAFSQQPLQSPANSPVISPNYPNVQNSLNIDENIPGGRSPKRLGNEPQAVSPNSLQNGFLNNQGAPVPTKPTLISAQMQIVDKNTDIYSRGPGEQEGLPEGLSKDDMTKLLYTFNYTVGFHGHFEEGYTNGAKQGYYFVTGRNGVKTRVDYVADSKGFRPKISQEVLDLLSDDVPKPETEKEDKYGLKGYEFKWLYYPVDSKGR